MSTSTSASTASTSTSSDATSSSSSLPINIVGAGLAGSMAALLLAQQRHSIRLIESRPDFRIADRGDEATAHLGRLTQSIKRSINLALSYRGVAALKQVGLFDRIQDQLIPMRGRVMHDVHGKLTFQAYGQDDQAIYSVSRSALNQILLDELDKFTNVEMRFSTKVTRMTAAGDFYATTTSATSATGTASAGAAQGESTSTTLLPARFTIGADGAYSAVRECMRRQSRMDFSMRYITAGYKELTIPAVPPSATNPSPSYALPDWQGLHIWPRHEFMLIALPNPDFSFTCTLFAPFEGEEGLDQLDTDEKILAYFHKYYPDVVPLCPDLLNDFKTSPNSALLSVHCAPWTYKDKVVLIGDAAHATVPFYGQGMNCAFEDGLFFSELFAQHGGAPSVVLPLFNSIRMPAGNALVELSMANWIEMRSSTAQSSFLLRKKVEGVLHSLLGDKWIPLYSMVAFSRIQYDEALRRAQRQDAILSTAARVTTAVGAVGASYAIWRFVQAYGREIVEFLNGAGVSSTASAGASASAPSRRA